MNVVDIKSEIQHNMVTIEKIVEAVMRSIHLELYGF